MNTEPSKPTRFAPLAGAVALALAATTGCLPLTGGSGGAAPCAPAGQGQEGAGPEHPERAPLQAEAAFPGGVRWAVCGADPVNGAELLNLRSDDGGRNWTVTGTGIAFVALHVEPVPTRYLTVLMKELTIRGSMEYPARFADTLDMLGRRDLAPMITHRFPVGDFDQALWTLETSKDCGKVLITFD